MNWPPPPLSPPPFLPGGPGLSIRLYTLVICILLSVTVLEWKESVMLLCLAQIQRKTPLGKEQTLQIAQFPLFSHNCPAVSSTLTAELLGAPRVPWAAAFCGWIG